MENNKAGNESVNGTSKRQSDLKKSFRLAVRSLLTTCSNEQFTKAFSTFTPLQQQYLHRLYIQVITSLHQNIEDDFDSICLETQVGTALDTVEKLVEEQSLDPLFSEKTNMVDIVNGLSTARKNEIQHLTSMLEKAEEHNRQLKARVEQLKRGSQDVSCTTDVVEKLKSGIFNYGACRKELDDTGR
ncbi:hypothetical protein ACFE04_024531 [Oxalis oulophora]